MTFPNFRHLAHGTPRSVIAWTFRMGVSTVGKIILETCDVIWDELSEIYLSPPNKNEWKRIANEFRRVTGMPNCVGSIDGKHIRIFCPPNAGSQYFNYKSFHSIVLLAVCDTNYSFTAVDIGAFGSESDGGVFARSEFGKKLVNDDTFLPSDAKLPNSEILFPHFFVADAAFPLKRHIMRPYPGRNISRDRENFNKKLSRARVLIENTFGILSVRWRILLNSINATPRNAVRIIKALVTLHNYLKLNSSQYCPPQLVDEYDEDNNVQEGSWRRVDAASFTSIRHTGYNATREAFRLRDLLKDHLNIQNDSIQ